MDGITFLEVIRCYLRWSFLRRSADALSLGPSTERAEALGARRIFHKASYKLNEVLDAVNELTGHEGQASPRFVSKSSSGTSALSHLDFRVDTFQFDPRVVDLHLPVDAALRGR